MIGGGHTHTTGVLAMVGVVNCGVILIVILIVLIVDIVVLTAHQCCFDINIIQVGRLIIVVMVVVGGSWEY